jgi:hypothetical protein
MYRTVQTFAPDTPVLSPYFYAMNTTLTSSLSTGEDARTQNKTSKQYRDYMSDQCSSNWNSVCPLVMSSDLPAYPYYEGDYKAITYDQLTSGEMVLRSTAEKKFISSINSACSIDIGKYNTLVPGSPQTASYGRDCERFYSANPTTIDSDPVMNAVLLKPEIAPHVLVGIYNTAKKDGKLHLFNKTRLGQFFVSPKFAYFVSLEKSNK